MRLRKKLVISSKHMRSQAEEVCRQIFTVFSAAFLCGSFIITLVVTLLTKFDQRFKVNHVNNIHIKFFITFKKALYNLIVDSRNQTHDLVRVNKRKMS